MTFEQLQEANKQIKTTPIRNKDYAEVNQRIKAFRYLYPNGAILTSMLSNNDGVCVFKAEIQDEDGRTLGTGTAYEREGSTNINTTSYIENCETSAVGRALAMCGFGIDVSIASFEEVNNAISAQEAPKAEAPKDAQGEALELAKLKTSVLKYCNENVSNESKKKICIYYKVTSLNDLNAEQCKHYIDSLRKRGINIE